jgi:hypothetical protein
MDETLNLSLLHGRGMFRATVNLQLWHQMRYTIGFLFWLLTLLHYLVKLIATSASMVTPVLRFSLNRLRHLCSKRCTLLNSFRLSQAPPTVYISHVKASKILYIHQRNHLKLLKSNLLFTRSHLNNHLFLTWVVAEVKRSTRWSIMNTS